MKEETPDYLKFEKEDPMLVGNATIIKSLFWLCVCLSLIAALLVWVVKLEKEQEEKAKMTCNCSGYTKISYGKAVTCCGDTIRINEPDTFNKNYYKLNP